MTQQQGWRTFAPSALAWGRDWPMPVALDDVGIEQVINDFVAAAERADEAGLDYIELHSAHGYLMHSFLSPLSNRRTDDYGGSLENRMRFPLRVIKAVRQALPESKTLGVRINGSDWLEDGWQIEDACIYAVQLRQAGIDYISVSSGGARQGVRYDNQPAYQVHMAQRVRDAVDCPVVCAGRIADPQLAESIISEGRSDFIALGRALLDDPRWPIRASQKLGGNAQLPRQYMLATPSHWPLA